MKPTIDSVLEDLEALGVKKGDVIFVTADLLRVGLFVNNRRETIKAWLDLLMTAVGEKGTIVAAAYTPTFFRFKKNSNIIFSREVPTSSGALPQAMLNDSRALRSKHPTNSCVAIGHNAYEILKAHDHTSLSYSVLGEIIKNNGKHLMLGTIDRNNAPLALHYAQELMGLSKKEPTAGLFQTYYVDEFGEKQLFTKWDVGGCSRGGYKMLGHLLTEGAVTIGKVGKSTSGLIDATQSVEIATNALTKDVKAFICDDPKCLSCRGRWAVSGLRTPEFYFKKYVYDKMFNRKTN